MRTSVALLIVAGLLLTACGKPLAVEKTIYPTYGLLNEGTKKSKNVCYELSGNVIWSLILIETVVAPIYFIGWDIFNPIRLKNGPDDKCTFDG